jgi:hypothetical protein
VRFVRTLVDRLPSRQAHQGEPPEDRQGGGKRDQRLGQVEQRIIDEAAETRRHVDIVAEAIRESFKGVIDKTIATGRKVDKLIASNAIEHAASQEFIADHEIRIAQLEASQAPESRDGNHKT